MLALIITTASLLPTMGCRQEMHEPGTIFVADRNLVPDGAKSVAQGTGVLRYTPAVYGKIYVRDLVKQKTLSFIVDKRQEFVLDATAGTVSVNGDVTLMQLSPENSFELFFVPVKRDKPEPD